jgi:hypothetical protein
MLGSMVITPSLEHGVAVGRSAGAGPRADQPRRAGLVLDDEALAEDVAHLLRDDARGNVDGAARGKRDHHLDRPCRIGLRPDWHRPREAEQQRNAQGSPQGFLQS